MGDSRARHMSLLPNLPDEQGSSTTLQVTYNTPAVDEYFHGDAGMAESWKQWEGEVIGGEFPLREYLGASDRGAVFLTDLPDGNRRKAVLRLVPVDSPGALPQLAWWAATAPLSHPHLLPILASGRCNVNGVEFAYVVMEYAEENLAQVLPQRPLTPEETRQAFQPVLDALAFLHGNGLVHGNIKPANILAVADQVKLSGDCLSPAGQPKGATRSETEYDPPEFADGPLFPSADVWSLGVTLVEVLMRRMPTWDAAQGGDPTLPEGMPQPFAEIARHCLRLSPHERWTVAEIAARLRPGENRASIAPAAAPVSVPVSTPETGIETFSRAAQTARRVRASRQRRYRVPAAVLAFALLVLVGLRMIHLRPGIPHPQTDAASNSAGASFPALPQAQPPSRQEKKPTHAITAKTEPAPRVVPKTIVPEAPKPSPIPSRPVATPRVVEPLNNSSLDSDDADDSSADDSPGVLHRRLPQVSPGARNTIQGHVRVNVKVSVDTAGNVTNAAFESAGPSKYFARSALQAAQDWKFVPAQANGQKVPSEWILRFAFGRGGTDVHAARVKP